MAAMAGITGSTWTAVEMAMAIGTTIAALAVLLVVSEMITAMTTQMMVIETRLETFRALAGPSPIVLARPVSRISEPRAMPAPKRRIVPSRSAAPGSS